MKKSFFKNIFNCILFLSGFSFFICSSALSADKTVGVIMTGNSPYYREIHKAFTESLSAEGINAEIVLQTPMPDPQSWANSARKLAAIGSDIIISYGAPATISTSKEVSDIPIVFAGVYDPAAVGISGNNVTGISSKVPVVSLLKNLKKISDFSTLGVVYTETEKDTLVQLNEVKQSEKSLGFTSVKFNVRKKEDTSKIEKVDALFLTTSCVSAVHCTNNIIEIARQAKIPTASTIGSGENSGVILTITANPHEQGNEAAKTAARIIKGAKPASIAVGQPKKVDLIINIKEATDLGLKIPFDLLTSATKVIK
jgi:putative tryptophan/tyrosine transport system substrate-binding protein